MAAPQISEYIVSFVNGLLSFFNQINLGFINAWWLTVLFALAMCFFGIKIFNMSVFWFGALFGGAIGYVIGNSIFDIYGGIAGAILLGIICAILLKTIVRIGAFITGSLIGALIGTCVMGESLWVILFIVFSGILGAVFLNHFIIFSTALWGALLLTGCISIVPRLPLYQNPAAVLGFEVIVFAAGLTYQLRHSKKFILDSQKHSEI